MLKGALLRYMHANGASMFFIVVYLHIFRMLREGAWVVSEVPKELHARLISPWLTGERGIGDGTRRPELEKMTAISLVCARFLKFLEGFWP
jgi:hypothetical protein